MGGPNASLLLQFELQAAYLRLSISLGLGYASNLIMPSLKTNNILHLYGAFHQPQVIYDTMLNSDMSKSLIVRNASHKHFQIVMHKDSIKHNDIHAYFSFIQV